MGQIVVNYVCIFIIPITISFAARFFCRRARKAYLVTVCPVLLAIMAWVAAALLTGVILRPKGRK